MNVKQQADYVITTTLNRNDYAVAFNFIEACNRMSAEFGTPIEDIVRMANIKLAVYVSNRSSIDT